MSDSSIRQFGLIKLIGGGILSTIMLGWIMKGHAPSASGGMFKLILLSMPLVTALMVLLEVLSGKPFTQFSEAWDELAGWQRGIFGVLIVIMACILIMVMVALFA